MVEKQPTLLTVLSGRFDSQPDAYASLRKAADELGLRIDLKDVDVIREAPHVRLAHYFRPGIVGRLQNMQDPDNTLIVLRPSELTSTPLFPPDGTKLRLLGKFAGMVADASVGPY